MAPWPTSVDCKLQSVPARECSGLMQDANGVPPKKFENVCVKWPHVWLLRHPVRALFND